MNRKFEDKLVEFAFGDTSPEEARRLEACAASDPEAARALQTYRDMRGGLRALADVPEHQLSNERLRDAILARGLQQEPEKPAPSSRGWLWLPVATCVMAFAFVMMKNRPSPSGEPQLVGIEAQTDRVARAEFTPPRYFVPSPTPVATTNKGNAVSSHDMSSKVPVRVAMNETVSNGRRRFGYTSRRNSRRSSPSPVRTIVFQAPPISSDLPPSITSNEQSLEAKADNLSKDQPIVLIATDKDAGTGTQVATEVQSASNVLVGG